MKKNLASGGQYLEALQGRMEVKSLRLSLNFDESILPPYLEDWLGKLSLLYGVPFEHLVPNAAMLPIESMRFFYVDPNWTSCLVDGALSVGSHSSRDTAIIKSIYKQIQLSVNASMQLVRRRLAGAELQPEVDAGIAVAGLLIRSQLISGWPGLEIAAYESYTTEPVTDRIIPAGKIENLRIERLAPDVMLCLYAKMPALVQLNEPKEGLCFGERSNGELVPRYLGYHPDQPVGVFITENAKPDEKTTISTRNNNLGVIDVIKTKDDLKKILAAKNALSSTGDLSPADFAIQLIKSAEQQSFVSGDVVIINEKDCKDY